MPETSNLLLGPDGDEEYDEDFAAGEYEEVGGACRGIVYADGIVPDTLRESLEKNLDKIATLEEKDFHPGSEGMVQDLIHPSMYPYVRGVSMIRNKKGELVREKVEKKDVKADVRSAKKPKKKSKRNSKKKVSSDSEEDDEEEDDAEYTDEDGNVAHFAQRHKKLKKSYKVAHKTAYQWLPAEFSIDDLGGVSIDSYINNLDRQKYPELYEDIASVFSCFLPLFKSCYYTLPRKLQVIVKAANYLLKPGEEYKGSWHVEGVPKVENIVASGIYYYHVDKRISSKAALVFREKRYEGGYDRQTSQNLSYNFSKGKVLTPSGRCLTFLNDYQHKVRHVRYEDDSVASEDEESEEDESMQEKEESAQEKEENSVLPAVRKILCFFVVDPKTRIPSSADVPAQQGWDDAKAIAVPFLKKAGLPDDIVSYICSYAKWGFTKEEAEEHRLKLMNHRKYYRDSENQIWEREYSFCEH
eukprot:TRINITY_DN1152_c1_g1_i7.p1 TRINITY_DN1152_c1_g1~~TRINITY_DN1152_c1_g1_i7.p1  ORF type:complete len:470 (-),score=101.75 TRINITY_DN1152_c1_g1_i7:242-1651(-)